MNRNFNHIIKESIKKEKSSVIIHTSTLKQDVEQAETLRGMLRVRIKTHKQCPTHGLVTYLKKKGKLAHVIEKEYRALTKCKSLFVLTSTLSFLVNLFDNFPHFFCILGIKSIRCQSRLI